VKQTPTLAAEIFFCETCPALTRHSPLARSLAFKRPGAPAMMHMTFYWGVSMSLWAWDVSTPAG